VIEQAACVPYRPAGGGYEVLLITTRKGKWTIPKGIVDPGETPEETAAKEAFEEAGIRGEIEGEPVGSFSYQKWGEDLEVQVFLFRVTDIEDDFEDADFRRRRWLEASEARALIRKRIRGVLERATSILDARFESE
jgi:8-oxo-dGTP pyrophosphatase MutT (NUDIX family)